MRIHWLFKYYFVAFIFIFSIVYYIENSKPYVDWSLYPNISENEFKSLINKKNCIELQKLYKDEYLLNYDKKPLPNSNINARIIFLKNEKDFGYLAYQNFDNILKWNRSNYFAIAVGSLSDYILYGK